MPKDRARNDMRNRIAYLAARLMAQDGIEDYGLAKRKAMRQVGAAEMQQLPTNEEIDEALRAYRQLYHKEEHRWQLQRLREKALHAMRELAQFNPYLTGSVLSGSAGKYADIDLQLFTDNPKSLELYLIDRRIAYRTAQCRIYAGEELRTVPVYIVNDGNIDIQLTVLSPRELRAPLRTRPDGRAIERAKTQAVEALLAQT
jgi:hypothetical protein